MPRKLRPASSYFKAVIHPNGARGTPINVTTDQLWFNKCVSTAQGRFFTHMQYRATCLCCLDHLSMKSVHGAHVAHVTHPGTDYKCCVTLDVLYLLPSLPAVTPEHKLYCTYTIWSFNRPACFFTENNIWYPVEANSGTNGSLSSFRHIYKDFNRNV